MEKAKHSVEFEAEVDTEGKINFSRDEAHELQLKEGTKVTVRIVGGVLSKKLARQNVSDEEIEHIGKLQLEDREHVVKFLSSEGMLSNNRAFQKRVIGVIG